MRLSHHLLIPKLINDYTQAIADIDGMTDIFDIISYLTENRLHFGVCGLIQTKYRGSAIKWIDKYCIDGFWWGNVPYDYFYKSSPQDKLKLILGTLNLRLENLKKELDCIKK